MKSVFPYPGGKTYLASWIIDHFPRHECYVEPFVGGSSVFLNKDPSFNEVINDVDGDIVHFFKVLRDREDELVEWLNQVPCARDVHEQWVTDFYDGERSSDPIERAGRFFFLRYSQYAGKYDGVSGFSSSVARPVAKKFRNKTELLHDFSERYTDVQIENKDYEYVFDRFDSTDTFFYCDPPYVEEGDDLYSHDGSFDHERFVASLRDLNGRWCVSYRDIPHPLLNLDGTTVVTNDDVGQFMNKGMEDRNETDTEVLVMNYEPDVHAPSNSQLQLGEVA